MPHEYRRAFHVFARGLCHAFERAYKGKSRGAKREVARRMGMTYQRLSQILNSEEDPPPPLNTCLSFAQAVEASPIQQYRLLVLALLAREEGIDELIRLGKDLKEALEGTDSALWPLMLSPKASEGSLLSLPCYRAPVGPFEWHPEEAIPDRTVQIDPSLVRLYLRLVSSSLFALHVEGNSMEDRGIADGDLLICEQVQMGLPQPEPGDVVAAWVEGEGVTIKEFRREKDIAYLAPCSKSYRQLTFLTLDRTVIFQGIGLLCLKPVAGATAEKAPGEIGMEERRVTNSDLSTPGLTPLRAQKIAPAGLARRGASDCAM